VVADVVDTLAATGGNALKLVHTHDGAAAAAMALAYGTPKDRKRLVKGMKGEAAEQQMNRSRALKAQSFGCQTACRQ
jgi:pumilio family protein 6